MSRTCHETRNLAICDECGKVSLKSLSYRDDFGVPTRLCRLCVDEHDNHPLTDAERMHTVAMDSDHDDF
ncbi:hypothetical protein AMC81_CH01846 [Rhizobium phaseoli]|uniref:Uncharacterized protein n=1 Tax=Rhizobium phaseoli TaxID=396 RepID=A0ABM6C983_9HYPH|nr:hypothetical protein AMC81_CH01846 [Rhizobium phaseoli]ANL91134.1 hypothetical protein AMC80_CH01846 [Rhizobium phaseoli]